MKKLALILLFLSPQAFALNAPGNLLANSNVQRCFIHWTDTNSSPNEDATSMQRSDDGGMTFNWIGRVAQDVVNYTDLGLTSGFTYFYQVRAVTFPGPVYSSFSNVVACTPL